MQLNYSNLKVLKLEIYSSPLFLVKFFCPCYLMKRFCCLTIQVFLFLSNAKSEIFAISFSEKPPKQTKDPKGPCFAKLSRKETLLPA